MAVPMFCQQISISWELDAEHSSSVNANTRCLTVPRCHRTYSVMIEHLLNVRSLLNKFDDIVKLCRDRHIDLLCLTESWHDADSAVLGRLRCSGYNVVDRPRPRVAGIDDISVNHDGVVVMAAADVSLSPISVCRRSTVHVRGGLRSCRRRAVLYIVLLVYQWTKCYQDKLVLYKITCGRRRVWICCQVAGVYWSGTRSVWYWRNQTVCLCLRWRSVQWRPGWSTLPDVLLSLPVV